MLISDFGKSADNLISRRVFETARHRTAYLEAGPHDGRLMIFIHGWPELGVFWRAQLLHFAAAGWRCIAPDMRGFGGSSVPKSIAAYAVRELVADMVELHATLGGEPAVWIGHDWGSAVAWSIASHQADRCRGVVNLCVPYLARGMALPNMIPLVDRALYPVERYPVGQWDYWLYYREHFVQAARDFEADLEATLSLLVRTGSKERARKPGFFAAIRENGGWFGEAHRAPKMPRDEAMLSEADFGEWVDAFRSTGFAGADAWYLNDAANIAYAAEAADFGRIRLQALFIHAARDVVCDTVNSRLAEPMREDCADLTEVTIDGGHELMLECADEVNEAIGGWLAAKGLA